MAMHGYPFHSNIYVYICVYIQDQDCVISAICTDNIIVTNDQLVMLRASASLAMAFADNLRNLITRNSDWMKNNKMISN